MQSVDGFINACRRNGLRITLQRRAIIELLAGDSSHPTAEEVYQHVVRRIPDLSRATVYSTLHVLVSMGELTLVKGLGGGEMRYDTNTHNHDHLFCTQCHALVDVDQDLADGKLSPVAAAGYRILRRQVTYYGICPNCQALMEAESSVSV